MYIQDNIIHESRVPKGAGLLPSRKRCPYILYVVFFTWGTPKKGVLGNGALHVSFVRSTEISMEEEIVE
jgi:hypothetical protein